VPHCRADAPPQVVHASPVVLAPALSDALPHHDVLVNLDAQVPRGFERFARVLEIVSTAEQDRQDARERWKHYAERGYKIVRHDLALQDSR
jgi:DNA polymerase-3 subunit chi